MAKKVTLQKFLIFRQNLPKIFLKVFSYKIKWVYVEKSQWKPTVKKRIRNVRSPQCSNEKKWNNPIIINHLMWCNGNVNQNRYKKIWCILFNFKAMKYIMISKNSALGQYYFMPNKNFKTCLTGGWLFMPIFTLCTINQTWCETRF